MAVVTRRSGFWALACIAAVCAGCVGAIRQERTDRPGERTEDREETAEVKLHLNPDEGRIASGRDAAARGDYPAALVQFDAVYRKSSADPKLRAQALYQSALVHNDALNPRRDPQQAAAVLRTLMREFPDSEWNDEAEALLTTLDPPATR